MKDSAVKGFTHCFATGGYLLIALFSAGEFKNSKLFSVTIHDWMEMPDRWTIVSLSITDISARPSRTHLSTIC